MEIARHGPVLLGWTTPEAANAGNELLRGLVRELGGPALARIERLCPACGSRQHGAPRVAGEPIAVSLAYAGALVIGAAVREEDAASIGVDAEPEDRRVGDLAALFAPEPPPDLAGWTRIEAVLKATGRGVRIDPSTVEIGREAGSLPGTLRTVSPPGFAVATLSGPEGVVVSLAVADGSRWEPSAVRRHR